MLTELMKERPHFRVVGHRGASGHRPENTMAAFRLAFEQGAGGLELDVHLTRDGKLAVIHDFTLDRTTDGQGPVAARTMQELKQLDAGQGEQIPELEEVLQLVKEQDGWVNVELKAGSALYPGIEERVIGAIKEQGLEERVVISSFDHYGILKSQELAPEIMTAMLYIENLVGLWQEVELNKASGLHPVKDLVHPGLIEQARQRGLFINTWTVDDPQLMAKLLAMGVDAIMTNYPDRLRPLL